MADMSSFSRVSMEVIISVILLVAVCIPILTKMTVPSTMENGDIISTLISVIPVLLAVAIILGVVYSIIIRRRD